MSLFKYHIHNCCPILYGIAILIILGIADLYLLNMLMTHPATPMSILIVSGGVLGFANFILVNMSKQVIAMGIEKRTNED